MYRKMRDLIKVQFGYSLLPINDLLDSEVRTFGTHIKLSMDPPERLISGVSTPADRVLTVHCTDGEGRDNTLAKIRKGCDTGEIERFDVIDSGSRTTFVASCKTPGAATVLRQAMGVKSATRREKSTCWIATEDLIKSWYSEGEGVVAFVDGWSGKC